VKSLHYNLSCARIIPREASAPLEAVLKLKIKNQISKILTFAF